MNRTITVVTAVHAPSFHYLPHAYASLLSQKLPEGWEWQWVIQEDGTSGLPVETLPADERISHGQGRPGGPGVARTMALSRATGSLVKVLDADDTLTSGALLRDIDVLASQPDVAWTTSRVLDLLPDGRMVGFDQDPPEGRLERGSVLEFWKRNDYRANVHPATMCIRRDVLFALGGWMALPASEDTGLLLAANAVSTGYFIADAGLLYRKWPGQVTNQPAHTETVERQARMDIIGERAEALRLLVNQPSR